MKITKKLYRSGIIICSITLVILVLLISIKTFAKKSNYLAIGDTLSYGKTPYGENTSSFVDYLFEDIKSKDLLTYNKTFTQQSLNSNMLLKFIEKNAGKEIDNQIVKIDKLIKSSSIVTISIGTEDLTSRIKMNYKEAKAVYDVDALDAALNIAANNIYGIIEGIKELSSDVSIYVLGTYMPYTSLINEDYQKINNIFKTLNASIKEVCIDSNVNFIDIYSLSNKDYLVNAYSTTLSNDANLIIANKVKDCIVNKKCN